MWCGVKWLVVWSVWASRWVPQPTAPVRLAGGAWVRGLLAPDGRQEHYFGIPYATLHPAGRFQAPGPEPGWAGVFDAWHEHVRCPQLFGERGVWGREQCLVLNVYRPAGWGADGGRAGAALPVMVFVHGGGFQEGSGSRLLYGPEYLVAKGVVLVTFNYRLNLPGFLCLGTRDAPGNAGLKDQLAALRWVRKNIGAFGGDPDNVTIFGESAGATSVMLHVVSPASRGLFHRAIVQSGTSIASWVVQSHPVRVASEIARALGYETQDPAELYNIFMNTSISDVLHAPVPKREGEGLLTQLLYTPCVERRIDGVEPFLTEKPYDSLSKGNYTKVPLIIGVNEEEGFYFAGLDGDETVGSIDFEKALPQDLEFPSEEERREVAHRIRTAYIGNDQPSVDKVVKLSKFYGEPFFFYPAVVETELLLNTSERPLYNYLLRYDGWRNFPKLSSGLKFWFTPGATHADELFYLFRLFPAPALFEGRMIDRMTTMWTNFAKYGEPIPAASALLPVRWPTAGRGALVIGGELRVDEGGLGGDRLGAGRSVPLWRQVYDRYRKT